MDTLWRINGRRQNLDPADRGLAYGDGLFETMACARGEIRWLEYHLDRLRTGCERLRIPLTGAAELRAEIQDALPKSGRAIVKLIVTRGTGERGYRPPEHPAPTHILGILPWPKYPRDHYTRGIDVETCSLRLGENPALAGLKHLCRLEQVLAQMELERREAQEGLMLDYSGHVIGGTSSNLFAVQGELLLTPSLDRCGVHGVMRRIVMDSSSRLRLGCRQLDLQLATLMSADEIFVTNAVIGVWPVRKLDGKVFAVGAKTRALQALLGYGKDA